MSAAEDRRRVGVNVGSTGWTTLSVDGVVVFQTKDPELVKRIEAGFRAAVLELEKCKLG